MKKITYQILIKKLSQIGINISNREIADLFDVTEQAVSIWKKKNHVPSKYLGTINKLQNNQEKKSTVDHLLEKILALKTENELLKKNKQYSHLDHALINNLMTMYDGHHSSCVVEIKFENFNFMRRIQEVEGKINCSKFLGYSIDELEKFWKVGEWYGLDSHPIEKIVSKDSIISFKEGAKLLLNFAKLSIRGVPDDYKIKLPVNYIHKNGNIIPAILDTSITFKPIVCEIKTTFFKPKNL